MNYFKDAEQLLASVPALELARENLQNRFERLVESGKPPATLTINPEKYQTSKASNDAMSEFLDVVLCKHQISETEKTIAEIYKVLCQIPKEHKALLEMWYIKKLPKEKIMEQLHIDGLKTVYSLRNKAVSEFALRYYGAPALNSL